MNSECSFLAHDAAGIVVGLAILGKKVMKTVGEKIVTLSFSRFALYCSLVALSLYQHFT